MSGFGNQYGPLDFARGCTATIHACEWSDLVIQEWDLYFAGKETDGRKLHNAVLPAYQLEGLLKVKYAKEVMIRRGIFRNSIMRRAANDLSADDMKEIDYIFELVRPYLKGISV
jgi:dihydrodipicolinate synthase/N-acetylneuraminate lyase